MRTYCVPIFHPIFNNILVKPQSPCRILFLCVLVFPGFPPVFLVLPGSAQPVFPFKELVV